MIFKLLFRQINDLYQVFGEISWGTISVIAAVIFIFYGAIKTFYEYKNIETGRKCDSDISNKNGMADFIVSSNGDVRPNPCDCISNNDRSLNKVTISHTLSQWLKFLVK